MLNAESSKVPTALCGINYTNTSHIRTRTDLLTYYNPLCGATTQRFTVRLACRQNE
jgi:hypothetical protein